MKIRLVALIILMVSGAGSALADTITLNYSDSGWYRNDGFSSPMQNYLAGNVGSVTANNFFVFNLLGVTGGDIYSARLRLLNPDYNSVHPNETYTLFDVSTPVATLLNGAGGVSVYDDLGSGTVYGSTVVNNATDGTIIEITLNDAALSALQNGLGGFFAFGGAVTSLDGLSNNEYVFGNSGLANHTRQLVLETGVRQLPGPSTMLLFATGLMILFRRSQGK